MTRAIVVLAAILLCPQAAHAQYRLWDGLQPGPHAIGYRLIRVIDPTRAFPGQDGGRPVELRVWYPALPPHNLPPLAVFEYLQPRAASGPAKTATSEELIERTRRAHQFVIQRYGGADTAGLYRRFLYIHTAAFRDLTPARGRFPVILYGTGANQGIDENTVLWEMLASHGYVVAAVPSVGVKTTTINVDAAGLEAEARDMEVALGVLRSFPFADVTKLATMGFSWGGAAALVVGMRQLDTDAIVMLDASTVAPRFHLPIRRSPLFEDVNLTAPVLHIHAAAPGISLALVEDLRYAEREYVEISGLDHIDFNSYMLLIGVVRGPAAAGDSALNVKRAAYRNIVTHVLGFLDTHLKSKPRMATNWSAYLTNRFRITHRSKMPLPITADQLLQLIQTRGIEAGEAAYQDVRRRDPRAPVLEESTINQLGYALYNNRQFPAAERVFLWNVRAYPESANTYDSLADAYIALNKTACAVAAYRKVLEKLPADKGLDASQKPSYAQRANDFIAKAGTAGSCPDVF